MGFFNKLLGKAKPQTAENSPKIDKTLNEGDCIIVIGESNHVYKIKHQLSQKQEQALNESTLVFRTGDLFEHYWEEGTALADYEDSEWMHKVVYFWRAGEVFEKKSLPPPFQVMDTKHFLFTGDISQIDIRHGQVAPHFGMVGGAYKYYCRINEQMISIPALHEQGFIDYLEQIPLTNDNLAILKDREQYLFYWDEQIAQYRNNDFYIGQNRVSLATLYTIGAIWVVKQPR